MGEDGKRGPEMIRKIKREGGRLEKGGRSVNTPGKRSLQSSRNKKRRGATSTPVSSRKDIGSRPDRERNFGHIRSEST